MKTTIVSKQLFGKILKALRKNNYKFETDQRYYITNTLCELYIPFFRIFKNQTVIALIYCTSDKNELAILTSQ